MATRVTKKAAAPAPQVIVNQITVRSADRSRKDIGSLRDAHKSAESVIRPNRTLLYDVYADVVNDGHLSGVIQKRRDAVLNKKLYFSDAKGQRVKAFDKLVKSKNFRKLRRQIFESQLWGVSGVEFFPGKKLAFEKVPRKHIKPEKGLISKEQSQEDGWVIDELPFVWIIAEEKGDLGLLLKCAPYAIYKKDCIGDWSQYVEIFGQPVRVMKYDAFDPQTKSELDKIADESGSSLVIKIPKQVDFEMMDGKISNGDGKLQQLLKDSMNAEMSVIILGNTETTSSENGGSNAKSQTHAEQQLEITKSDLEFEAGWLNDEKFLAILATYDYPVEGGEFVYVEDVDPTAVKNKLEAATTLRSNGVPVDDDYFYEVSGIPKPKNYDAMKKEQAEKGAPPPPPRREQEPPEAEKPKNSGKKEDLSGIVTREEMERRMDSWLDRVLNFFGHAPER